MDGWLCSNTSLKYQFCMCSSLSATVESYWETYIKQIINVYIFLNNASIRKITYIEYPANTDELFVELCILKLNHVVGHRGA